MFSAPSARTRTCNSTIAESVAAPLPCWGTIAQRLELAHSLMLTLPGSPVLRYGDEIGMGEDLSLNERDSVRTPMQWADARNAGFSSGSGGTPGAARH